MKKRFIACKPMRALRTLQAKSKIFGKREKAIKIVETYSKRCNAGISLVNSTERQLQNMAQTQSFAGLLYTSPQFVRGMYMFIRGYRIFAEKYREIYPTPTCSTILRQHLDVEKQILITTIPTIFQQKKV